jgi:hypothetical protein
MHARQLPHRLLRGAMLAAAIALSAHPAAGQAPPDPREAQPERPTVATHAFTVAPGIVELETGVQWQRPSPGLGQWSGPVLFKIGLAPRLQLDVAPGWISVGPDGARHAGLADAVVGIKWLVGRDLPVLGSFSVQPTVKLPTGRVDDGTGTGTTDASLLVISSRSVGPVSLDINAGYTHRSGDGLVVPVNGWLWTVSTAFPLRGPLGWTAETFGYPATGGVAAVEAFLTGPTWKVRKELILDAGAIFSLGGFGGTAVYAGLTWNIGRLGGAPAARAEHVTPAARPPRTSPPCG